MSRTRSVYALLLLACLACEEPPPPEVHLPVGRAPVEDAANAAGAPAASTPEPEPAAPPEPAPADWTVEVDPAPITLGVGELILLRARVVDAAGAPVEHPIRWTSSANSVAWVSPTGEVLGVSAGAGEIVAHAGAAASPPISVSVTAATPPAPSYAAVVDPILRAQCATAGCHVDGVEPGDLRFDRGVGRMWEELVEDDAEQTGTPRVLPGAPGASYLVEKLVELQPTVGGRMPLGRAPLSAAQMQIVITWIAGGAPR